jgi:hypothetical protein
LITVPLLDINKAGIFFGNKLSFCVAELFCCASVLTLNETKIIPTKRIEKYFFIQLY